MPTFTPPIDHQGYGDDILFSRYRTQVGQTVIKKNGVFVTEPYPWLGDLNPGVYTGSASSGSQFASTALVEGVDYFLGGHGPYVISPDIAAQLTAAGYTVGP